MSAAARGEAVEYRRRGWSPIPIKGRSKEPNLLELRPYLNRKATREELDTWRWSGVGIVTGPLSGVLVLDADGAEGEEELRKYGHPVTPMVRTPGGGLHLYFKHPEQHVRTGIRVAQGLDVKASGGYVVAPPSVGPNGQSYEWIVSPEDAALADPPEWLMRLLERPKRNGAAPPVGEKIPPGRRNQELTSIAGTMRRRGMDEEEIRAALGAVNARRCDPPLEEEEVNGIAASVARYAPAPRRPERPVEEEPGEAGGVDPPSINGRRTRRDPGGFNLTDLGNSERFIAHHGEDIRYCYPWRKWLVWTGARWERDDAGRVHKLAKETVRLIYREASDAEDEDRRKALAKHATQSEAEAKIRAMLELAKSEAPISPDDLDADPWLFNTANGTIDLRTGVLRDHRREDLITKLAPVEHIPAATAPAWEHFLQRVLPGEDLRGFVQRAAGYSATGNTSEQCMFINHGTGANGKSTFQETISAALGDYAMRTPTEMLLAKRSDGVPNDIARLKGSRFVSASETEEGRRLAESRIKDLTGQDTITARFMRAEWFDFEPVHKLWLSTNHKPEIRGTDQAIWRRIRLVPWTVVIPPAEQDKKLSEKLRAELPGVLAWIVQGCLEWRRKGLQAPEEVRRATVEYRAEMDVVGAFLAECCVIAPEHDVSAADLYKAYGEWCKDTGETQVKQRRFGGQLTERGDFERYRGGKSGGHRWRGLDLLTLWKSRICRDSDPSAAKDTINAEKTNLRGNNRDLRSEGSEGSADPVSGRLAPGQSATVEQLQRIRKLVGEGMAESAAREEVFGKGWVEP
jgi:putative DNA primase/helicase